MSLNLADVSHLQTKMPFIWIKSASRACQNRFRNFFFGHENDRNSVQIHFLPDFLLEYEGGRGDKGGGGKGERGSAGRVVNENASKST